MEDDVSKMRQKRLPGIPRTHLGSMNVRVPCREPEVVARFWSVMLGSEPRDLDGIGVWHLGASVGRSGHSFEFHPAPEQMTDLSSLVLHILTEDLETTTRLAVERGGTIELEQRNDAGKVFWRKVVDPEGNAAHLLQIDDLDAWWGRDDMGKSWPPAGTSPHIYIEEE